MLDKYFPIYALAFFLALSLTVAFERILIPKLKRKAQQPIYDEGPSWHEKKKGTPTMGGLAFLLSVFTSLGLAYIFLLRVGKHEAATSLLLTIGFAVLNSIIGIIDDITKLHRRKNAGLSPKEKLFFQALIAVLFLVSRHFLVENPTHLTFSFGYVDIGPWYYPLTLIILLGIVNCANLTDGIDGLAGSVAFGVGISLFYISSALSYEVSFIASAVVGASLGFLMFNLHPAKIFMGDTGSLFFGAIAAASAVSLGNPLLIIPIGGIYVIEGISVILQVGYFKLTRRRIFKMAPIHHHFEKLGWSENRICIVAILLTFLTSVPAYMLYLP